MAISGIFTDRAYQDWPSWHLIFEWEDEISQSLGLPIKSRELHSSFFLKKLNSLSMKTFNKPVELLLDKDRYLYFEILMVLHKTFSNSRSAIPVIIDFWEKNNIGKLKRLYGSCERILISNLEVFEFLRPAFGSRLVHFPLSLPTKYTLKIDSQLNKEFDLLLAGRSNPVLLNFLNQYVENNPEFEYTYQEIVDNKLYYKTNKGRMIGQIHSREDYMKLLRKARVAFYSVPGIDGGERRTNGFNPVTPRLLEFLAAGCHVIGRFDNGADTEFYELNGILPNIRSYEQFEGYLSDFLKTPPPISKNASYLEKHYTSTRIPILKNLL
ncbi:MAG: hypothetical protein K0S09_3152 [Sphingobacteriaceae bacterium]|jgi:hypothetical protein|nr:hypothetical protein [Sphingobacteriaceae bacterium]